MHLGSREEFDRLEGRLIDLIYSALVRDEAWAGFLAEIARCTPNGQSTLFFHDQFSAVGGISLSHGIDSEFKRQYVHYAPKNLWMQNLDRRPIGLGVRSEYMAPFEAVERSEYYNELLKPFGISGGIGITLQRTGSLNFMLSIIGARQDDAERQHGADMLTRLAPHLDRVFRIYRQAQEGSSLAAVGEALACQETGLIRVGPGKKIQWLNEVARVLLDSGEGPRRDAADRLQLRDDALDARLGEMLQPGAPRDAGSRTFTSAISRAGAAPSLQVTLANSGQSLVERFFAGPTVIVLLRTAARRGAFSSDLLASRFDLTRREREVAMALAAGHSLQEIAEKLSISYETARAYLKQIFAKTGTRRQGELLTKLYRTAGDGG
ncbi:helix-turn-helix transcriptional regulator [Xanthobacter sp. KR7-225]